MNIRSILVIKFKLFPNEIIHLVEQMQYDMKNALPFPNIDPALHTDPLMSKAMHTLKSFSDVHVGLAVGAG